MTLQSEGCPSMYFLLPRTVASDVDALDLYLRLQDTHRHRVIRVIHLSFDAHSQGLEKERIIEMLVYSLPVSYGLCSDD